MLSNVEYQKILGKLEGNFDKYYKHLIPDILLRFIEIKDYGLFASSAIKIEYFTKFASDLLYEISKVTTRSLIDFYNRKKEFEGVNYQDFNSMFEEKKFMNEFINAYPVMHVLSNTIISNYLNRVSDVLDVIHTHSKDISEFISLNNPQKIEIFDLDVFKGDFHKENYVVILTVNNKKIILKRKCNIGDRILKIFSDYFERDNIRLSIVETKILSSSLCLQKYITATDSLNQDELEQFYFNFGILSSIFSVIGTNDLHFENVIAKKSGPYFIDLEAALSFKESGNSYSLLKDSFLFNVDNPHLIYGNSDLSAFSGMEIYNEQLKIYHSGEDDISIGKSIQKITKSNVPKDITNKRIDPYKYKDKVLLGYRKGMELFWKYKQELVEELSKLEDYNYRVILRNTGFYSKYLDDIASPVITKNPKKFVEYIQLLGRVSNRESIVLQEEMECIQNYMVPYFSTKLFIDDKQIKEEFLKRVTKYSKKDESRELYYLKMMLNIKADSACRIEEIAQDPKARVKKELYRFIEFCSNEHLFSYGTVDNTISDQLMDYRNDLYTFGGSMLFVNSYLNNMEFQKRVINTVSSNYKPPYISGLTGYQSGLILEYLLDQNDKQQYISSKKITNEEDTVDFSTYGSAIIALDFLYQKINFDRYVSDLYFLGEIYLKKKISGLTGLFHGYAGDCVVLCSLMKYMDKKLILKRIQEYLVEENKYYSTELGDWIDTRKANLDKYKNLSAISYGAPGILLSRLILYKNPEITDAIKKIALIDIVRATNKILKQKRFDYHDDTIVNGYSGAVLVLKILMDSDIFKEDNTMSNKIRNYLEKAQNQLTTGRWRYSQYESIRNFNFFNGRLGTAFVLSILIDGKIESSLDTIFLR